MTQEKTTAVIEQVNDQLVIGRNEDVGEQYLTFFMNKEEFGIDILSVQEIRGWEPVTAIPNSPDQVLGVMNLRGTVAPVIDLRMCFGLERIAYNDETVVIILTMSTDTGSKIMGIVVDAVSDVHKFDTASIQPSPQFSHEDQAHYIKGLGSTDEQMVILLDLTEQLIAPMTTLPVGT